MDNVFITQHFDWREPKRGKLAWANRLLARLGLRFRLTAPGDSGEQTSIEQRINLFHLLSQVLAYRVSGDIVEIGTHQGSTAVLLQMVNDGVERRRSLHVYDAFWGTPTSTVEEQFRRRGLTPPVIHIGRVEETLPAQLPERIAFAHIDLGWGQSAHEHQEVIHHSLQAIYPRLSLGGICVIADYCEPDLYGRQGYDTPWAVTRSRQWNLYPAVKAACDRFLTDKPVSMVPLYGGPYSHGYFRKALPAERWWAFASPTRQTEEVAV